MMLGTPWYSLLANPMYAEDFAYISISEPHRRDLITTDEVDETNEYEQSDLVCLILNLAFVDDNFVKELTFGPGMSEKLQHHRL